MAPYLGKHPKPRFSGTRTRTSNQPDLSRSWTLTQSSGGSLTGSYVYSQGGKTTRDVVTPGFRELLAAGVIINNPFSTYEFQNSETAGIWEGTNKADPSQWFKYANFNTLTQVLNGATSNVTDFVTIPEKQKEAVIANAKLEAMAHLDSTPFRFGEDFLETKKAISTLRSPINTMNPVHDELLDAIDHFRRKSPDLSSKIISSTRAAISAQNAVGKAWLTARYAYGSLVYTGLNLHNKAIWDRSRLLVDQPHRRKSTGERVTSASVQHRVTYSKSSNRYFVDCSSEEHFSCKARILYTTRHAPRPYNAAGHDWGLRLKDMPRAAWQVMPLTWYSDRLLNVSSMIQGAMNYFDPNVVILAASYTTIFSSRKTRNLVGADDPNWALSGSGTQNSYELSQARELWEPSAADLKPQFDASLFLDTKNAIDTFALSAKLAAKIASLKF